MSFLRKLFGLAGDEKPSVDPESSAEVEYRGFLIRAVPRKEQGQYLVAGTIEKTIDGVVKRHHFVRADRSPDRNEISEMSLMKARLMIDQQGDGLLS